MAILNGIAFGGVVDSKEDLLGTATAGKVNGSAFELSSKEMKDVVGGYLYQYDTSGSTSIYFQRSAKISEGYYGYNAKIFYRKMNSNGSVSYWINYYTSGFNGPATQAYGTVANQLVSTYQKNITQGY